VADDTATEGSDLHASAAQNSLADAFFDRAHNAPVAGDELAPCRTTGTTTKVQIQAFEIDDSTNVAVDLRFERTDGTTVMVVSGTEEQLASTGTEYNIHFKLGGKAYRLEVSDIVGSKLVLPEGELKMTCKL
jgi:hypothetical protein